MTENMELYEKGLRYLKQFAVHPNVLSDYQEGELNFSLEPSSALYWLNDDQKETVKKLEETGKYKVVHVIRGVYGFNDGSKMEMETYLLVTKDCPASPTEYETGAYYVFAYVKGDFSEYGDVVVKGSSGGLKRLY